MSTDSFFGFKNVGVLGASGKMGRGIVLLLAKKILFQNLKYSRKQKIFAFDLSIDSLIEMVNYIEFQSIKYSEKNIILLREMYSGRSELFNDTDFVQAYLKDMKELVFVSDNIDSVQDCELIFEAVAEDIEIKSNLLSAIDKKSKVKPYYFTNTSSIPISVLEKKSGIEGRVIGLHFYNPPPVQKLLEIIKTEKTELELIKLADDIAELLNKTVVYAPDCAGFIGNGQFLREVSFALSLASELSKDYGIDKAIYTINQTTKILLLRPMGIFEVVDYVGINVCDAIMTVMQSAFPSEKFNNSLLKAWIEAGVLGGQDTKGKTKNGIFKYESGQINGVFNGVEYSAVEPLSFEGVQTLLWKDLKSDKSIESTLNKYFSDLQKCNNSLVELAITYGKACCSIGEQLVVQKIAFSKKDVNKIMTLGFHHLYGPVNVFFESYRIKDRIGDDE